MYFSSVDEIQNLMIPENGSKRATPKKRKLEEQLKKRCKNKVNSHTERESLIDLKKELLQIEIYKAKLEAFKLERDLKLPASKYTQEFIQSATKVQSPIYCMPYSNSDSE